MAVQEFKIGNRKIGPNYPTYIISEIGINHNGDIEKAKELIKLSKDAGADAVKFQKRHLPSLYPEELLQDTKKFEQTFQYMIPILKEVELSDDQFVELKEFSDELEIEFLCTPFDKVSADFLDRIGVNGYKVASADLTNHDLISYLTDKGKPLIVSTGMSYWAEIEKTVSLLKDLNADFSLLHCRSVYPVWPREVNLKMIDKLRVFGVPVGYSGHDIGITIPLVAASMGASIIEKHVTLDKKMKGPDHKISLEPFELKRMIRDIRVADQAMGRENRYLLRGEVLNRELFGKSLVANDNLKKGTIITDDMVTVMGPGKGLSPDRLDDLKGVKLKRDVSAGDYFTEDDIGEGKNLFTGGNDFKTKWGLIARFGDFAEMVSYDPELIEFHLAERDFDIDFLPDKKYRQELVVHAPEYIGEKLLDLCSGDEDIRKKSVELVNRTVRLTRKLSEYFEGKPKVIAHPGAMSLNTKLDKNRLRAALIKSVNEIHGSGVEILMENLPPYPWYFGGQWKGNYFMGAEGIAEFCKETGTKICFDFSHAALYCNAKMADLADYVKTILPYTSHLHIADGYGLDGEGVQLGEGDIDFDIIMPLFKDFKGTWVPEVWRGHLENGKGFIEALVKLKKYDFL